MRRFRSAIICLAASVSGHAGRLRMVRSIDSISVSRTFQSDDVGKPIFEMRTRRSRRRVRSNRVRSRYRAHADSACTPTSLPYRHRKSFGDGRKSHLSPSAMRSPQASGQPTTGPILFPPLCRYLGPERHHSGSWDRRSRHIRSSSQERDIRSRLRSHRCCSSSTLPSRAADRDEKAEQPTKGRVTSLCGYDCSIFA